MISIIIINHNQTKVTWECIRSIEKYTNLAYELIVFNNGPTKNIIKETKKLKVYESMTNLGFARACNKASKKAKGDILVFLNNDCIVTKNWIKPLVSFLHKNKSVAAVQPKVHSLIAKDYFDYAAGAGGFIDILGYPFTRGRVFDSVEKDIGQYDDTCEITWASGACLVIKKAIFERVGGFDEFFFLYHEELDLCLRIEKLGYKIYCLPESLIFHHGSVTINKDLSGKVFRIHYGSIYLFLKHYSIFPYFPLFILRIFMDLLSIAYYFFEGRSSFIKSVVKAYLKLLLNLPLILEAVSLRGMSLMNLRTVYRGSIVFNYFILRKRNYDQIIGKKIRGKRNYKRYVEVTSFL